MYGLIEVDVTDARRKIRECIRVGQSVSFMSWFIKVVGAAVSENKYIHAVNSKGRKQVVFDEVDISLPIEKNVSGKKVPLVGVVRNASDKSIEEIYGEIKEFKNSSVKSEEDYVLGKYKNRKANNLFFNIPQFFRIILWNIILSNPFSVKRYMGTVMVTTTGTGGGISGWILPKSIHNLSFAVGSICRKPCAVGDSVVIREILNLTVAVDHDVVDGLPSALFINKLVRKMERAEFL